MEIALYILVAALIWIRELATLIVVIPLSSGHYYLVSLIAVSYFILIRF